MIERYINNSPLNVDNFIQGDYWLFKIKIGHYDIATIVWNLALLLVPFGCALAIKRLRTLPSFSGLKRGLVIAIIFFVWLLFIPNAAYIMSEVRHINSYCPADTYYHVCLDDLWQVFFFFLYALVGWLAFYHLLRQMSLILVALLGRGSEMLYAAMLIPLIALGMLLGLVNRFNSWEFLSSPGKIFSTAASYVSDWSYFRIWFLTAAFLFIFYRIGGLVLKKNKCPKQII